MTEIGFLHPGAMGAAMATCVRGDAHWVGAGRSEESRTRAEAAGMAEISSLASLVARCEVIVSICPPASADAVSAEVAALEFDGLYVDANAISPELTRTIGARFDRYVDGSVVGLPPRADGSTRLYLSGPEAPVVAGLWAGSDLEPVVLGEDVGAASALKMAYATWTKVRGALLLDVCALAEREGVSAALAAEWDRSQPGSNDMARGVAAGVGPKAWRFVGEMEQMVATFGDAGLPTGFAAAAADIYTRLAGFKGAEQVGLAEALDAILGED